MSTISECVRLNAELVARACCSMRSQAYSDRRRSSSSASWRSVSSRRNFDEAYHLSTIRTNGVRDPTGVEALSILAS